MRRANGFTRHEGREFVHHDLHGCLMLHITGKFFEAAPGNDATPVRHVFNLIYLKADVRVLAHHQDFLSFLGVRIDVTIVVHIGNGHHVHFLTGVATNATHNAAVQNVVDLIMVERA